MAGMIKQPKKSYNEMRRELSLETGKPVLTQETTPKTARSSNSPKKETGPRDKAQEGRDPRGTKSSNTAKTVVATERTAEETVRVRFNVAPPLPGQFPLFDTYADHYGSRKAMALILGKAFPYYQSALLAGQYIPPVSYEGERPDISSSRPMQREAFKLAKQSVDPLDIEKTGTIARKIAMSAFATWLNAQNSK